MIEIKRTPEVEKWLRSLKDRTAKAKILMRLERMEDGNFGDVEPIGDGLSELRIHQGKGYRVYFGNKNNQIILLLCGGDKSTQQADIRKAKQLAKQWGF
ncbi:MULTISPECIES: type II toxin-antitoxin system RelE/ParE family toxin [Enterobacterales]|uniref:Type II toxin-antitoxin system RelE/ParE family toxin n=8 Tax=Enterobacterales TaxID=91347 RepID=A0ABD5C7L2_ECOLX|nr:MULTISPECIES: type II toxin-antitoxin system RelE/ParE family toxin [Enterobacterales]EAO2897557.1 type II toxin-antitoxin system RelE/ParE family toxin [Salmonella enterica]EDQ2484943.1 type II toxin-antitoxin system RelE/ParE family toxin [Salmonella enterica subsp. enterica serovar Oranienburg]EDX0932693.1 type II toxin-antitoxin system RelE/ParE family toxin [Salmonella enterica subsp. enterica]HAT7511251.1 type II toxin-antitoxin system RelE/ParE family toxin [Enterobacter asburiae]HBZ